MDRHGVGAGGPYGHHQGSHSSPHGHEAADETQGKDTRVLSKAKGFMLHARGWVGSAAPRARWVKRGLFACLALYAILPLVALFGSDSVGQEAAAVGVAPQQLFEKRRQQGAGIGAEAPAAPAAVESVVDRRRQRGRQAREAARAQQEQEEEEDEEEEDEEPQAAEEEEEEDKEDEEEDEEEDEDEDEEDAWGGWDAYAEGNEEDFEEDWGEDEQAQWLEEQALYEEDGDGLDEEEEEQEEDDWGMWSEEEEEDGPDEVQEAMEAESAGREESDADVDASAEEEEAEEEEPEPVVAAASASLTTALAGEAAAAGAAGARPAAFDQCGHWQEEYMALHRKIVSGELPPKYLVSVVYQGGLADQLVGIVTAFYWALLSSRAFQITVGHQKLPPFEAAFAAPFINWTRPLDPDYMTRHLYADFKNPKARHFPRGVNASRFASLYLVNDGTRNKMFRERNLTQVFHDREAIFVGSNRGRSYRMFDNPFHMRQLADMGLRPETAFGCAFRFLFEPNNVVEKSAAMEMARKFSPPQMGGDVLRIGLQIRVGDFVFKDSGSERTIKLDDYQDFFDCATEIEEHKKRSEDTKVIWYLISDSKALREQAQQRFGDKVWTQTHEVKHMSCGKFDHCDKWNQTSTIADAAADMLSLAQADALVLTQKSGFGKVAAWTRIDKWHHIWWPDKPIGKGSTHNTDRKQIVHQRHKCTANNYVKTEDMADGWSGI